MSARYGLVILAMLLSGQAWAATRDEWPGIAIYNAKQAVEARLRDPGSAEFRNVGVYWPVRSVKTPQAVCGEVNGKNGFGGFTGYQAFVWLPFDANLKPNLSGTAYIGREARNLLSMCRDNTY